MIVPTIIAENQCDFSTKCNSFENYLGTFHLDVMDGVFVNNKSLWFDELRLPVKYDYEVHLMVDEPEKWIDESPILINENATFVNLIIANFERVKKPSELIEKVKNEWKRIGFALNPETDIEKIKPYLKDLDCVLVLMVNPGQYGAKFIPECLDKVKALRDVYTKDIEVDGGINPHTIKLCKEAGANIFAVGSYIQKSPFKAAAFKHLESILRE